MNFDSIVRTLIVWGLPILGIVLFLLVNGKMYNRLKEYSPTLGLALIFLSYGILLLIVISEILSKNSVHPFIGILPPIMATASIAYYIRFHRMSSESNYHHWILKGLIVYPFIVFILVMLLINS